MKESPEVHFTPEQELLLWSIRVDHAKDQRIEEILKAGIDWNYVRETAIQHGIIPLLYKRLKEEMEVIVPSEELMKFRKLFMANAVRNIRMTQQLLTVLDLLADAGVETMPFKGPALAVQAYGNLSMRSFCDLDILIHEREFERMYEVLLNAEFVPNHTVNTKGKKKLTLLEKDITFYKNGIPFEVHWTVAEPLLSIPIDPDQIWNRAVPLSLGNHAVKSTISVEDSILIVCIHGMKHFWQELKWLADLTYLIENNQDIDWHGLVERAESLGVKRLVGTSFFLTKRRCGISFPAEIENFLISDVRILFLTRCIEAKLFCSLDTSLFSVPPIFFLKSRERIRDQISYILKLFTHRLFIPDSFDFNYFLLPECLYPLYSLIRPFRLITGSLQSHLNR